MKRTLTAVVFAIAASLTLWPPFAAAQGVQLLPNLVATPAHSLSVALNAETGNPELRFGATSWNSGAGPLELLAGELVGGSRQNVYQRIYLSGGGYTDALAGDFVWHGDHNHFHFEQYAQYILTPVVAPGGSERQSSKTSFCVMDTTKMNTSLPGAPKKAVYTTCSSSKQGMSVGWGDTYGAHLAGQSLDLATNPDGLYELTLRFDSANRLRESNENDNSACTLLDINVAARTVQVAGACGTSGTPSITSITPSSIFAGSTIEVTISGANFFPGIAVGFENGSRPAPVASNINVLDSNTIKATVYVRANGRGPDYVWDLRVGSAVKADAFTVVP
jgi:hypothetical protein